MLEGPCGTSLVTVAVNAAHAAALTRIIPALGFLLSRTATPPFSRPATSTHWFPPPLNDDVRQGVAQPSVWFVIGSPCIAA
jgi:hypothetical protein